MLLVDGLQKFDRNKNLVARLNRIEQDDRLQIVAHSHAPTVEIQNLGSRAITVGTKTEPEFRSSKIVSVERRGYLNPSAGPEGLPPAARNLFTLRHHPAVAGSPLSTWNIPS